MSRRLEPTPGPGHYDVVYDAARSSRPSAAFQSRSRRVPPTPRDGPSPGQYDPIDGRGIGYASRASPNASARGGAHTFIYRSKREFGGDPATYNSPGPASYDAYSRDPVGHTASSGFKSNSAQRPGIEASDTLGAGSYDVTGFHSAQGRAQSPTSAFRSTSPRAERAEPASPGSADYSPYEQPPARGLTAAFKSSEQRQPHAMDGNPGVGQYDPYFKASLDGRAASFTKEARFREDAEGGSVGPGAYDVSTHKSISQSSKGASSMFRSRSPRSLGNQGDQTPGPGSYYEPHRGLSFGKDERFRKGDPVTGGEMGRGRDDSTSAHQDVSSFGYR
ncbi:hypothetical protein T492DRAFT_849790 [Pavlovales sp. CCMP2436]|nr:hypothetical protein T492DRAFT_849790 [Pavlovales sp. CCMP2436]